MAGTLLKRILDDSIGHSEPDNQNAKRKSRKEEVSSNVGRIEEVPYVRNPKIVNSKITVTSVCETPKRSGGVEQTTGAERRCCFGSLRAIST